jgi:hypothetical protein
MDDNTKAGRAVPCAPQPHELRTVYGAQGTARPAANVSSMPATARQTGLETALFLC